MGTLYVIATPIGNLEDITLRALRVLAQVGLVAAENTRTTRNLMSHYGLKGRLTSFREENKASAIPVILSELARVDVALVCDAGVPGVSDPGRELVAEAANHGFFVVPIPGPSAVTVALAAAGLPANRFQFLGFLPRRRGDRLRVLDESAADAETLVLFEAPHRLRASLRDILAVFGDREIVVCRELTKLYEEVFRGLISEAIDHFETPRGEFTLVVAGSAEDQAEPDRAMVRAELVRLKEVGMRAREAVGRVATRWSLSHREVYRLWLGLSNEGPGATS